MKFKNVIAVLHVSILLLSFLPVHAQIKLPALVRDSMILQRDAKLPVWGWASKGEKVSVQFLGKTYKTTTGADGKWFVTLPALKAGGPFTMTISGSNKITLKDILVGDVWFCSGQSNMVHQMRIHRDLYENDIQQANNPMIRHVFIPTLTSLAGPKDDFPPVYWKSAIPADVTEFSAVAYFFARKIYDHYKIPMGLINASVGGTPIEAWISEEGFSSFPTELATLQKNKDTAYINSRNRPGTGGGNRGGNRSTVVSDKGLAGPKQWYDISYEPRGWHSINVPGYWEDQGVKDLNGVVWYRKEINVPQQMAGKAAKLVLGRIVDADNAYINGVQVGNTTYLYPQRRYAVPAGVLKAGRNLVVVKVTNTNGKGGFVPDKPYFLVVGNDSIDLKGTWAFKVGEVYEPLNFRGGGGGAPAGAGGGPISAQNQPAGLYNAMVAPAIKYKVKGFLWYQGEANTGRAKEYAGMMRALVENWRKIFQVDNAPFFWVQLPGFMDRTYTPVESNWATTRESQLKALSVPGTGMAVAIDLGEWNDIHPDNKKDVGERLALIAEKLAYGNNDIVYSGPIYQSSKIEGNKIILSFNHIGGGLITIDGEPLSQFAIAGADKKFVWANARIEGNTVVVWNDQVTDPKYVRYAWSDNPEGANLFNKEGLPASPFRTDE
jgi:sialate O-acetylesterase